MSEGIHIKLQMTKGVVMKALLVLSFESLALMNSRSVDKQAKSCKKELRKYA